MLQRFSGLEITGSIDAPTLSMMHSPRCGMIDTAYSRLRYQLQSKIMLV